MVHYIAGLILYSYVYTYIILVYVLHLPPAGCSPFRGIIIMFSFRFAVVVKQKCRLSTPTAINKIDGAAKKKKEEKKKTEYVWKKSFRHK